jgi:hypothetical protein
MINYSLTSKIVVHPVTNIVPGKAPDRALKAMRKFKTVGAYLEGFGRECERDPLPSPSSPGTPEGIMLYLHKRGDISFR